MKIIYLAGVLALCSFTAMQDQDPKAKTILDEVSKKTKAYTTIQVEFTLGLKNSKNAKINELNAGKATIKGDKYILDFGDQKIYCDGKTVCTVVKGEEPMSEPVEDADDEMNPTKLLTIWEKGFKSRYVAEIKENSTAIHEIHLSPTNPSKTKYHTVVLKIDKVKSNVHSVTIKKKNNDINTLTITKFTPNVSVTNADFKCKK